MLTEKDFGRGDGVVFLEEDVPFTIQIAPDTLSFSLQWCLLPTFDVAVGG